MSTALRVACRRAASRAKNAANGCRLMSKTAEKHIEKSIKTKLEEYFTPEVLHVRNESFMHKVPKGSETHFRVTLVSSMFEDQSPVQRHRMVHEVLKEEIGNGVHALAVSAKTPEQWSSSSQTIGKSPACRGGTGL